MTTAEKIQANLVALGFTNTSATAIYNKIAQAVGQIVDNTVSEITNSETTITNLLISQYGYGKPLYYTAAALMFQYGDNLIVNMSINPVTGAPFLNYVYAEVDTTKQIITQAAFEAVDSGPTVQLFLKVATTDSVSGLLVPLSNPQYTAFVNYFLNFQVAGLPVSVINAAANILDFTSVCTYFSTYDLPTLQANIATALNSFQKAFQFNGEFYSGDLESYIKTNVPGVRDFFISNTTLDGIPFNGSQSLLSGYFNYNTNVPSEVTYNPVTS
jgi:hypothetical protein